MTLDLGKDSHSAAIPLAIVAVVILVICGGFWAARTAQAASHAKAWTPPGPPCAVLSEPAFRSLGVTLNREFSFGDVQFARQFGHAACDTIAGQGGLGSATHPACRFTSPQTLKVSTADGAWYFATGAGQPVVVWLEGRTPHCVTTRSQSLS